MSISKFVKPSNDGKTITIQKLDVTSAFQTPAFFTADWEQANKDDVRVGAVIDVETTGLNNSRDQIIEVGLRQFQFHKVTGEILSVGKHYSSFADPGTPLSAEITELTGITDQMVKGQKIDWHQVDQILGECHIIVAHNAGFDRPFIDAKSKVSAEKIWGCSLNQIQWKEKGFPSQKLDLLAVYHGFFTEAHRALNDAESLLFLLSRNDVAQSSPYFLELITEARKPSVTVFANHAPFEVKDDLKERRYRWNQQNKVWYKRISKDEEANEIAWLTSEVYLGNFRGKIEEIQPKDRFKRGDE